MVRFGVKIVREQGERKKRMGSSKVEIEKFDGRGDFNIWRKKMKAILVQQKCAKALGGEKDLLENMSATDK